DIPRTPHMKTAFVMANHFRQVSDTFLQEERDRILQCSLEDIKDQAGLLKKVMEKNYMSALGDENKIKKHQELFGKILSIFE
ncbi:MAG TPA: hypothetical protein DHN33_00810, partial [Eubacteriaceae bacterium]|nr:hypothetical protein [Eubacteriaceae bacterium]